ncbi:MAG TPA: hypothetical protein VMW52_02960 [Phycisphaerae bacterium]|nr:hypothetical protein [Phycisphaerae bacterium]
MQALMDSEAELRTENARLRAEAERLRKALEEREHDMHMRIRLGYDKTVADSWRAENARLRAEVERLRGESAAIASDGAVSDGGGRPAPSEGLDRLTPKPTTDLAAALIASLRAGLLPEDERKNKMSEAYDDPMDRPLTALEEAEMEIARLRAEVERLRGTVAHLQTWTHEKGANLKPRYADTYGDGMRAAQDTVARIIAASR